MYPKTKWVLRALGFTVIDLWYDVVARLRAGRSVTVVGEIPTLLSDGERPYVSGISAYALVSDLRMSEYFLE